MLGMLTNAGQVRSYLERRAISAALADESVVALLGKYDTPYVVRVALSGIAEHLASADAALDRSAAEAARYAELAHARWELAERLRGELAVALQQAAGVGRHRAPDGAS